MKYNMEYTLNNFFYIGGNCADIGFLGDNRIKGPVDNMIGINGLLSTKSLFEQTIISEFHQKPSVIKPWKKTVDTDPGKTHIYKNYQVVHNIPTEQKFLDNLEKRFNAFLTFYEQLKSESNLFFIYHINEYDMNKKKHIVYKNFYKGIEYLQKIGILDKLIIVQTKNIKLNNTWNYNHPEITKFCNKKHIKNIIFEDNSLFDEDRNKVPTRFLKQINEYLNNYK